MPQRSYSIHGIITFKIADNTGLLDRVLAPLFASWDIELQGFDRNSVGAPDFVVSIGKFNPNNRSCIIVDDDFHIKEDYLYCRDHYKYAKWQLEMFGFEQNDTMVHIQSNLLGKMLMPELLINPLIWLKLTQKGYPVIHASGIVKDTKAFIFAGQGASGKSTVALSLVEKGYELLSDHYLILNKGEALSFPSPLHITDFNITPFIKGKLEARERNAFRLRQLFDKFTGKKVATKVSPQALFPGSVATKAKVHSIFLLLPRGKFKVEKLNKEEFVSHMLANQKLEFFPFTKYMMEYAYLFPRSNMATYWTRYEESLRQSLDIIAPFYKVEVPRKYDDETLGKISRLVSES